ncbi:MAG: NusG domain II-containing protein [Gammaproteobacteria bacterium]|nr:NusG domain II-containing protein [Gammaproteobacteria bacterium]
MTRGDYAVLALCALTLPALFMRYGLPGSTGTQARITTGNAIYAQVPLSRAHIYRVPGALGISEIEVRDGRIRFNSSPCQGQQCVHSGWAKRGGEFIACVPNRVSISVLGQGAGGDYYDSINF